MFLGAVLVEEIRPCLVQGMAGVVEELPKVWSHLGRVEPAGDSGRRHGNAVVAEKAHCESNQEEI